MSERKPTVNVNDDGVCPRAGRFRFGGQPIRETDPAGREDAAHARVRAADTGVY